MLSFFIMKSYTKKSCTFHQSILKKCLNEKKNIMCGAFGNSSYYSFKKTALDLWMSLERSDKSSSEFTLLRFCSAQVIQLRYDQKTQTKTKTQYKEHFKFFTEVQSKFKRRKSTRQLFFPYGTEISPLSKFWAENIHFILIVLIYFFQFVGSFKRPKVKLIYDENYVYKT